MDLDFRSSPKTTVCARQKFFLYLFFCSTDAIVFPPYPPCLYRGECLLDLALEVLAFYQVGDFVVILSLTLLTLLHVLVALGELSERSEGVGTQLVEDTGDELGELLVLTVAVDGEGVAGDSGVNW